MKTGRLFCLSVCLGCILGVAYAQETLTPAEQYKQERVSKRAYERFLYAKEMLEKSADIEVINEAVQDAVRYATTKDEDEKALRAVESAIGRLPVDGDAQREAILAKGKLLTRLGSKAEAETLFQDAIRDNWNHAMWRYSESLIETDCMADACLLECQRIAGLEKYAKYRGEEESLEIFLTLLRLTKDFDSNIQVTEDVSGQLEAIADKPVYTRIVNALCLAEDGNAADAIKILEELNQELSGKKDHREYKHLPLYKASILFKEGTDYPAAEAAFTEFMRRNEGKNKKIVASALRLARDIEILKKNYGKIDEFATFLIESEWFKDQSVRNELSVHDIASLYDMQQIGLKNSGKDREALEICNFIITNYPETLAAKNCLRTLAQSKLNINTIDEVTAMYHQILQETDDDTLTAIIHYQLAKIARLNKDTDEAILHIQESLRRVTPHSKGVMSDARKAFENLRESLNQ